MVKEGVPDRRNGGSRLHSVTPICTACSLAAAAHGGNAYPLHIPGNVVGRSARGLLAMAAAGGCSSSMADGGGHNMPSFASE